MVQKNVKLKRSVFERLVKIYKDRLVARDLEDVKKEITNAQFLINEGRIEEAVEKLIELSNILYYIMKIVKNEDIVSELLLAQWRIDRAIEKLREQKQY